MCPEAFNVIKVVPVSFFFLFQCQPESNINCDYFVTNSTCIHFCKMNSKFTRVIKEHFLRKRVIFCFFSEEERVTKIWDHSSLTF